MVNWLKGIFEPWLWPRSCGQPIDMCGIRVCTAIRLEHWGVEQPNAFHMPSGVTAPYTLQMETKMACRILKRLGRLFPPRWPNCRWRCSPTKLWCTFLGWIGQRVAWSIMVNRTQKLFISRFLKWFLVVHSPFIGPYRWRVPRWR